MAIPSSLKTRIFLFLDKFAGQHGLPYTHFNCVSTMSLPAAVVVVFYVCLLLAPFCVAEKPVPCARARSILRAHDVNDISEHVHSRLVCVQLAPHMEPGLSFVTEQEAAPADDETFKYYLHVCKNFLRDLSGVGAYNSSIYRSGEALMIIGDDSTSRHQFSSRCSKQERRSFRTP